MPVMVVDSDASLRDASTPIPVVASDDNLMRYDDLSGTPVAVVDAKADSSTKGIAAFAAADFNDDGAGLISLDYTNGQASDASHKGFLTAADWTTFNSKIGLASLSGTSPVTYNNGTGAIGFDFSTNNTWTGTQYINVSSATALKVGSGSILVVDSSAGRVGIGMTPAAGVLDLTSPTVSVINSSDTLSTAETTAGTAYYLARIYSFTKTASSHGAMFGMDVGFLDQRTLTKTSSITKGTESNSYGLRASVNRNSSFAGFIGQYLLNGFLCNFVDQGVYSTPVTSSTNKSVTATYKAGGGQFTFSPTVNITGSSDPANDKLTYNCYGMDLLLSSMSPVLTTGSLILTYFGLASRGTGGTTGTTLGFGLYNSLTGFDTTWAYWNDTTIPNFMGGDNAKSYFGTGANTLGSFTGVVGDASIMYDGTDLVINSSEVGAGTIKLNSANNWTANGVQIMVIGALGPAAVVTPGAVAKWLTVKDNAGVVHYIPAWV